MRRHRKRPHTTRCFFFKIINIPVVHGTKSEGVQTLCFFDYQYSFSVHYILKSTEISEMCSSRGGESCSRGVGGVDMALCCKAR